MSETGRGDGRSLFLICPKKSFAARQGLHLTCTNHCLTETALYFVAFLAALASNIRSLRPIRSLRSCHPASRFGADSKLVYKYFISFLCNGMRHEFGGAMSMMMMPQPLPQSHTPQDTKCPWPRIEKENVRPTDSTHAHRLTPERQGKEMNKTCSQGPEASLAAPGKAKDTKKTSDAKASQFLQTMSAKKNSMHRRTNKQTKAKHKSCSHRYLKQPQQCQGSQRTLRRPGSRPE